MLLSFLIAIFNAASAAWGWFKGKKENDIGRLEQKNEDNQATLKGAEDAQRIREEVHAMSNIDLDLLLGGMRKPHDKQ